jgi:hypothetical protein
MAVAFWLGRFLSNLQWNLANASKRERRYAKMQRRARRKQDGLASQLEDLEYRGQRSSGPEANQHSYHFECVGERLLGQWQTGNNERIAPRRIGVCARRPGESTGDWIGWSRSD